MLNIRTLAGAFWASFFTLYWLFILNVVKFETKSVSALVLFFLGAAFLSVAIYGLGSAPQKRGGGNGSGRVS